MSPSDVPSPPIVHLIPLRTSSGCKIASTYGEECSLIDVVILSQCPDIVFPPTHKLSPSFTVGRMTRHWILEMMISED
jgi:hypothetical protein